MFISPKDILSAVPVFHSPPGLCEFVHAQRFCGTLCNRQAISRIFWDGISIGARMHTTHIGLLGFGTVGQGVFEITDHNANIEISKVLVRHPERYRHFPLRFTTDAQDILTDPDIDVVVEVMGGTDPAYTYMADALHHHKSVVTANKAAVARYGPELIALSREMRQAFLFEASVGGAIPVLGALAKQLSTVRIMSVEGVVNGTTNFILDQMDEGMTYEDALQKAQALGFAEQDPSADVDGWDSARKLTILAGLSLGSWIAAEDGTIEGITHIDQSHLNRLRAMGLGIRLVARAERHPRGIGFVVAPTVYPRTHRYLNLHGSQNAVGVHSDAGTTWLEAPGAGGLATATSIVGDIQRIRHSVPDRDPLVFSATRAENIEDPYVVFMHDADRPLPAVSDVLRSGPDFLVVPHRLPDEEGLIQYRYRTK